MSNVELCKYGVYHLFIECLIKIVHMHCTSEVEINRLYLDLISTIDNTAVLAPVLLTGQRSKFIIRESIIQVILIAMVEHCPHPFSEIGQNSTMGRR